MQSLLVLLLVILAAAYLVWHVSGPFLRRAGGKSRGCHGCSAACDARPASRPMGRTVMWMRETNGEAASSRRSH